MREASSFAIVLLFGINAHAVPFLLTHQGRLLDSNDQPVDAMVSVTFTLWDGESSTNQVWTETLNVDFDNGYYSVVLGQALPIDEGVVGQAELWLSLSIDSEELLPRQRVASTPYAIMAGTAENVIGGVVDVSSISVDGTEIVDSSGAWVGAPPPDTLEGLTCDVGDVASYTASGWACVQGSSFDTVLAGTDVRGYITGAAIDLAAGSQVDGQDISTGAHTPLYTDGDAVAAMGSLGVANPLHHDRYTDSEALAATALEVVQVTDARLSYEPAVFDCATGSWCDAFDRWGANRFSTDGRYTFCSGEADCSGNTVTLSLDNNTHRSVLLSHLDWSNSRMISVYLSFDGGTTYTFHNAINTQRTPGQAPYTSRIRTVASNLPLGADVRVRVVASKGRFHFEGFGLSPMVLPETDSQPYRSIARATGKGTDNTCDVNSVCGPSPLAARALTFVKTQADTAVRVLYTDVMRSYGVDGVSRACRHYVRFDGAVCPSGDIYGDTLGAVGADTHSPSAVGGYCLGLPPGTYTIQVYVGNTPPYEARCHTGWINSTFVLEAEEVQ